ncbi:MAG: B12-binding domain-containing radical SAM protein [Desulfobacteraceae bacterium]|nr:B12-binding domain-containing radical SAM protein [Desulfobacteraceae bacterium]
MTQKNAPLKKIAIIIPNTRWFEKRIWLIASNAVFILTAILKDKYDLSIIDANGSDLSKHEVKRLVGELKPDAVLVSGISIEYHQQFHAVFEIVKQVSPGIVTILGGAYATLMPEEAVKDDNISYIMIGHAEYRIDRLLEYIFTNNPEAINQMPGLAFKDNTGKIKITPLDKKIVKLKQLVHPDYTMHDISPYLDQAHMDITANGPGNTFLLMTSRGCPLNCVFCANDVNQGRGIVNYNAGKMIKRLRYLIDRYDLNNIVFNDTMFFGKSKHATHVIDGMIQLKKEYPGLTWHCSNLSSWSLTPEVINRMKQAGCNKVIISVESGSQRVLKEIIKKPVKLETIPEVIKWCRDADMHICSNFVIGLPGETWSEIRQTFKFAEDMGFDYCNFHIATPQPGTHLHHIVRDMGLLPEGFSFLDENFFGYAQGFIETDEFSPFELQVLRAFEWDRINFNTSEKCRRVADILMTTVDALETHRKKTRLKLGVHVNVDSGGRNRITTEE